MDLEALDQWSGDELAEVIGQVHALEVATMATMLKLVVAFERSEAWRDDGATSTTAWLAYRLGLSHRTAAEWVGMAKALTDLPRTADAFAEGLLSWDQLRAAVSMPRRRPMPNGPNGRQPCRQRHSNPWPARQGWSPGSRTSGPMPGTA